MSEEEAVDFVTTAVQFARDGSCGGVVRLDKKV
eukprot:CAMPEP_0194067440 /NCGR_PEP_ID=MMETSP0009_2-20130614/86560_1 /TAXON_ID=210454 /ORGANISM="Grammatophora oceanica, Strain CCMP 410" /LENGTH=32 /DNA_ID= /DNA_START= /DNA_END= /DNA_ORIENTATION=